MSMLFKRIKDWAVSITSFRTGDVLPVDGPSGTAKIGYSDLSKEVIKDSANNTAATEADLVAGSKLPIMTPNGPKSLPGNTIARATEQAALTTYAQNVAHSIAPPFVPNTTNAKAGKPYTYNGVLYIAKEDYNGAWDANKFTSVNVEDLLRLEKNFHSAASGNCVGCFPGAEGGNVSLVYKQQVSDTSTTDILGMLIVAKIGNYRGTAFVMSNRTESCPLEVLFDGTRLVIKNKTASSVAYSIVSASDNFVESPSLPDSWDSGAAQEVVPSKSGPVDLSSYATRDELTATTTIPSGGYLGYSTDTGYNGAVCVFWRYAGAPGVTCGFFFFSKYSSIVNQTCICDTAGKCPFEVLVDGTRLVVKNKLSISVYVKVVSKYEQFVVDNALPPSWDADSASVVTTLKEVNHVDLTSYATKSYADDAVTNAKRAVSLAGYAYFGNFPTAGGGGIVISYRRAGYASGMLIIGKYSTCNSLIHISDGSACPLEVLFDGTRLVVKNKIGTAINVNLVVTTVNFVTSSSLPAGWDSASAVTLTPAEIKPVVTVNVDETLDYSLINAAARINYASNGSKDFCAIIVTDSHNDDSSVSRAISYAGKSSAASALVHGGDYVSSYVTYGQASTNWATAVNGSTKPAFFVQGNHEKGTFFNIKMTPSDETLYNLFVKHIVDKGYLSVGEYEQNKCYYFHDFGTLKTRLIVLDEYRAPTDYLETYWKAITYDSTLSDVADNTDYAIGDKVNVPGFTANSFQAVQAVNTGTYYSGKQPCYKCRRGYRYIDQTEAQWFLDTLYSTPSDYVVVVAMHNPFSDLATPDKTKKFCQKVNIADNITGADWSQNYMATDFVADALNAFKTGASYSATISTKSNTEAAYIADYSVVKDFSARGEGKLGLIIGGHVHRDVVWKHPTYTYMYQVTPMCSITTSRDNNWRADIRLQNDTSFEKYIDSLTAFAVADGRAALAKLGCKYTTDALVRDIEIL